MRSKLLKLRSETKTNQKQMGKVIGKSQSVYSRKENMDIPFDEFEMRDIGRYFNLSSKEIVDLFFEDFEQ